MKLKNILLAFLISAIVTLGLVYKGYENNIFVSKNQIIRVLGYFFCIASFGIVFMTCLLYWKGEDKRKTNSG